jgi:serine/threonine-protein kinase
MQVSADPPHDLSGTLLGGQFRLEKRLGQGGMGDVYLAEQVDLGRRVVVKLLRGPASDPANAERFQREARALARLNHPNIVQVYAFGRSDQGTLYFAMEYLPGRTLGDVLCERGALPEREALQVLEQLCAALVEAHAQGIIHRDLKPDNVMLLQSSHGQPRVKVLDFGIAQLMHMRERPITKRGELIGTPLYMAPEQLNGLQLDERTDLYAAGLIGYELLTGNVPFEATTTAEVLARAVRLDVPVPSERVGRGQVSALADAIITRCLQREPDDRFQSAQALGQAVLGALGALGGGAGAIERAPTLSLTDSPAPEVPRRRRGRGAGYFVGILAVLLALIALALFEPEATPNSRVTDSTAKLSLKEWVQGIPFPAGTDYVSFGAALIEARVAAAPGRVLDFYRSELGNKWGGYEALSGGGLLFEDPSALIETLTVVEDGQSSRLLITRRHPDSAPSP